MLFKTVSLCLNAPASPISPRGFMGRLHSKGMFARKRVKGRNFSYEFGRLSKELQDELDKAIQAVLDKQ